jgi:hypothetical protein
MVSRGYVETLVFTTKSQFYVGTLQEANVISRDYDPL